MKLQNRLISFRKYIRVNQKLIIDSFQENHNSNICVFCGTKDNLTREHILPQWIYKKDPKKFFITNTNGISQTYNKSVLPCCLNCNNYILGSLEDTIQSKFKNVDLSSKHFIEEELELIILWLEIIAYKLQMMEIRRKFKKHKDSGFIPYLADFPIGILQNLELSPSKVFSNLRHSLKKLSIKSKTNRLNSLLVFKTTNPDFHFMHSANNFIFIELPEYEIAVFYFLNDTFANHKDAFEKCMSIIETEY